ncbi:MAG: AAA family ATPase [Pirellulaceae bacterium]|nr:AAA family ATPase [Pirellulaceae bacterium]
MSIPPFADLPDLAAHLRKELASKKFILLYAYNGTGKTRLSTIFKNLVKVSDEPDTLYFNAFTEDLFSWDNDLKEDRERKLKINPESRFITSLWEIEMDTRIRPFLSRYTDFDFRIDTDKWEVVFSRKVPNPNYVEDAEPQTEERTKIETHIKVSRGEENIFIWCFFLAVVQLAMDGIEAYNWVKYIYIDDPISSLDEHNAITVANHLAYLLKTQGSHLKTVISTHHTLFFNVLYNEFREESRNKKASQYFLSRDKQPGSYVIRETGETPFFHHVAALAELYEADQSGKLFTHHFNMLRSILEKTASFHGYRHFSACIKKDADDEDGLLHQRLINILSHGGYSLYEPQEMLEENKNYFRKVLHDFINRYPFNPALFPTTPTPIAPPAATPAKAPKKARPKTAKPPAS